MWEKGIAILLGQPNRVNFLWENIFHVLWLQSWLWGKNSHYAFELQSTLLKEENRGVGREGKGTLTPNCSLQPRSPVNWRVSLFRWPRYIRVIPISAMRYFEALRPLPFSLGNVPTVTVRIWHLKDEGKNFCIHGIVWCFETLHNAHNAFSLVLLLFELSVSQTLQIASERKDVLQSKQANSSWFWLTPHTLTSTSANGDTYICHFFISKTQENSKAEVSCFPHVVQ